MPLAIMCSRSAETPVLSGFAGVCENSAAETKAAAARVAKNPTTVLFIGELQRFTPLFLRLPASDRDGYRTQHRQEQRCPARQLRVHHGLLVGDVTRSRHGYVSGKDCRDRRNKAK